MRLHLMASGGFAGLNGPEVTVDLSELPEADRARVREALGPERLARLGPERSGGAADRETYRMEWEADDGTRRPFAISESELSAESLDVIDMLMTRGRTP